MVQNNNEQKKPHEEGNTPTPAELEKLKSDLQKEHDKAINLSKNSKAEILQELEHGESHNQKEFEHEMMRQTDFPHINPEDKESPEAKLSDMFQTIETESAAYDYSRTLFPKFTQVCEQSRIGRNFPRDILGLALGIGDSLLSTLKLAKDAVIDVAKVIYQPRKEFQETREFLS